MFSRAHPSVLCSLVTILLPSSSSTSHSVAGVATFSDGAALPLLQQCTGNLVLVMHNALPSDVHSRCSVACALLTTPLLVLGSLPAVSGSLPQGTWSHWCASALHFLFILLPAHVGISPGSPPSSLHRWFSREVSPRLYRVLRHRLSAMVSLLTSSLTTSSLSGRTPCTPLTCLLLPFVLGVLPAGAMTTPPQAVPLVSSRALPPAPSAMTRTAPSCITFLLALSHHNARTAWADSCGISLCEAPALAQHSWVFNPLDGANTPQTIQAHNLFVGHVCDQLQPPPW